VVQQLASRPLRLPSVHGVADRLATVRQRRYLWLVALELSATLAAAIVSQGATLLAEQATLFEAASAACLGLAVAMQLLSRRAGWNRDWYADRAMAEASVGASWRYIARIPPFETDDAAEERFVTLLMADVPREGHMLSSEVGKLGHAAFEVTPAMRALRTEVWRERARSYTLQRLGDQQRWYATKARQNGRRERWFSAATLAAGMGALVLVGLRVLNPAFNVIAVFTTLATSLIAWSSTRRFHELHESYAAVGAELKELEALLATAEHEDDFRRCAAAAEDAITREHSVWVVRRVPHHPAGPWPYTA
jgi:hypothetical protein